MIDFCQWDAKWKDRELGPSGLKMANFGCYVTTVAFLLRNVFMKDTDPGRLCDELNRIGGFSISGDLNWEAVNRIYPDVVMHKGCWTTNHPARDIPKTDIQEAIFDIRRAHRMGLGIGICVDNLNGDKWPDHIVVLTEAPDDLLLWRVMDPDGGNEAFFRDRYGDPMKGIYGYRMLVGSPLVFPLESDDKDKRMGLAAWKALMVSRGVDSKTHSKEIIDILL
jgi:hypothetical protein